MPHRYSALHRCHRGQWQLAGAVPGGVHPDRGGAGNTVDHDMPGGAEHDAGLFETETVGAGYRPDGDQAVGAFDHPAVGEGDRDPGGGAFHGGGTGLGQYRHASTAEDLFDEFGGVLVLSRQDAFTARHQRDASAQVVVRTSKLRPGDAGSHDDKVLGHLCDVIHLLPGEDAFPIGGGIRKFPWRGTSGDEHHVGGEHLFPAVGGGDVHRAGAVSAEFRVDPPASGDHGDSFALQLGEDVIRLPLGEFLHPGVDDAEVDHRGPDRHTLGTDTQFGGGLGDRHPFRGGDEGFGWHHVGEHRCPTHPLFFHHGDRGAKLSGHQGGFVSTWSSPDDDNVTAFPNPGGPHGFLRRLRSTHGRSLIRTVGWSVHPTYCAVFGAVTKIPPEVRAAGAQFQAWWVSDHRREGTMDDAVVTTWIAEDPDDETAQELRELHRAAHGPDGENARAELADRFAGPLEFGTAGLRGRLGGGPNRMNRAVVIRATAAVAAFAREQLGGAARVVIGYDARHGSAQFARDAASVFTGAGAEVMVLARPLPTPVLAFAVQREDADIGVMITASHNPGHDNGYKVYLGGRLATGAGRGALVAAPTDAQIAAHVREVGSLRSIPRPAEGWSQLGEDVVAAYVERAVSLVPARAIRPVRVVYTPMHGVAGEIA